MLYRSRTIRSEDSLVTSCFRSARRSRRGREQRQRTRRSRPAEHPPHIAKNGQPIDEWDMEPATHQHASHVVGDASRTSPTKFRGGTLLLGTAELRFAPLGRRRWGPFALAGVAAGQSRRNVNEISPTAMCVRSKLPTIVSASGEAVTSIDHGRTGGAEQLERLTGGNTRPDQQRQEYQIANRLHTSPSAEEM